MHFRRSAAMLQRLTLVLVMLTSLSYGQVSKTDTATTGTPSTKPHVIIIYTDDMGYGDISSFGGKLEVKTPNIDALAAEGRKFTEFYVASPICSPSRAALLSGMYAPETGLTSYLQTRKGNRDSDQNDYMDPSLAHMPNVFKKAGYATAHVGKWHLGGGRDVDNAPSIGSYGYDEYYGTWESPDRDPRLGTEFAPWDRKKVDGQVDRWDRTRHMVDTTLDFVNRSAGKPCFVTLWPDDLHTPFWPSPEMVKKHNGKSYEFEPIENFYGILEEYDRQIGRLVDGLKASGAWDNSIVIFTGDNGPAPHYNHLRNNGMRGMKLSLYEGGIRQPFIITWPGHVPAGTEDTTTVLSALDLLPSLASMADLDIPGNVSNLVDGQDMSRALVGNPQERSKPLLFEFGRTRTVPRPKGPDRSPMLGIREGDYKLLVNPNGSRMELYNLARDRNETTNLADDNTTLAETMANKVIEWSKTLPHRTHN